MAPVARDAVSSNFAVTHSCVTWLFHVYPTCDITHLHATPLIYIYCQAIARDAISSAFAATRDTFMRVCRDTFMYDKTLSCVLYMWCHSFTYAHMHIHVWHDSFLCDLHVTSLIYMWRHSFTYAARLSLAMPSVALLTTLMGTPRGNSTIFYYTISIIYCSLVMSSRHFQLNWKRAGGRETDISSAFDDIDGCTWRE